MLNLRHAAKLGLNSIPGAGITLLGLGFLGLSLWISVPTAIFIGCGSSLILTKNKRLALPSSGELSIKERKLDLQLNPLKPKKKIKPWFERSWFED